MPPDADTRMGLSAGGLGWQNRYGQAPRLKHPDQNPAVRIQETLG